MSHGEKHSPAVDLMLRVYEEHIFLPKHNVDNVTLSDDESELANVLNVKGATGDTLIAVERKIIQCTFNANRLIELSDSYRRKNGMLALRATVIKGVGYEILYKLWEPKQSELKKTFKKQYPDLKQFWDKFYWKVKGVKKDHVLCCRKIAGFITQYPAFLWTSCKDNYFWGEQGDMLMALFKKDPLVYDTLETIIRNEHKV
jgi:hypothetical protein